MPEQIRIAWRAGSKSRCLGEMGVRPELFNCVVCDQSVEAEPNRFSVRLGGILCREACGPRYQRDRALFGRAEGVATC